jgi:subtilisin family serine protease
MASFSQTISGSCYWVKLKDKTGTLFQISHPEAFLSKRALDRRIRQNIPIDQSDLPVSAAYLDTLKRRGLEVVHTSKWLNGVTVRTADTSVIRKIKALPFVSSVQLTRPSVAKKSAIRKFSVEEMFTAINPVNYGVAIGQLTQLNGHYLHDRGFRGKGVQIAILDAGFWHVNQIAAFDTLRKSGRILGVRDFVDPGSDIYQQHTHGMSVLSCMGGNVPLTLIGTAPDASYYLLRSEEDATEYPIEEDNWVAAAELADSLGVDVINSSLGYYFFDDAAMNHTYSEMDGKTTRVTRGANMAFQKGIVVFNSAGNEGNNTWKRIIAPSDGENVIAVAAVDKNGIRASFSSVGPAFGGAVKPNVAATGSLTFLVTSAGVPGYSSGTSFSSPVLAGMGACLLQSNPYATAKQIKMAIEQSASLYNKPDSLLGYGIPDFEKAYNYLKLHTSVPLNAISAWGVSPNPFSNTISIRNRIPVSADKCFVNIYTMQGVCLLQSALTPSESMVLHDLSHLPNGVLILTIRSGGKEERFKIIKMPN